MALRHTKHHQHHTISCVCERRQNTIPAERACAVESGWVESGPGIESDQVGLAVR